jgi:outer membrane protein TolC
MLKASFFTGVVTLFAVTLNAQTVPPAPPMETVTLEQAVERAIKNNPTVAQAAQDILRAEGLLQQARAATMPFITAGMSTLVNSTERRFDDVVTSPQTQATLSGASRHAGAGPVQMGRQGAGAGSGRDRESFHRGRATGIAVSTAQAYLAVIALKREVEVTQRALETSLAHLDYARRRLEAGAGTRVNELRAGQEVSTNEARLETAQLGVRRAQEALGVLIVSDGPADTAGDPVFVIPPIADEAGWMGLRPDVRLFTAEERAADRVWKDSSKDWFPTALATFDPQAIVPASIFTFAAKLAVCGDVFTADLRQRAA